MTDMKQLTLGRRIQALRKRQSLTQDALAELLGVTPQAVSKWENSQSCPDIMTLPHLARVLQVTTDLLLTGEDAATAAAAPARKPEELIVRMAFEEEGETRICVNLPFTVFRLAARYNMISVTFTPNEGEKMDVSEAIQRLQNMDFRGIVQQIESGVTGKLFDMNEDGMKLTIWTE